MRKVVGISVNILLLTPKTRRAAEGLFVFRLRRSLLCPHCVNLMNDREHNTYAHARTRLCTPFVCATYVLLVCVCMYV